MHADATALAPTSRHSAATEAASRRTGAPADSQGHLLPAAVGRCGGDPLPIYIAIVNSCSPQPDRPPTAAVLPDHPMWSTYPTAWNEGHSACICATRHHDAIIVVGQVVTAILAAYAFAFLSFPFRKTLFIVFLSTLMIPFEVTLITTRHGHSPRWYNTFQA